MSVLALAFCLAAVLRLEAPELPWVLALIALAVCLVTLVVRPIIHKKGNSVSELTAANAVGGVVGVFLFAYSYL